MMKKLGFLAAGLLAVLYLTPDNSTDFESSRARIESQAVVAEVVDSDLETPASALELTNSEAEVSPSATTSASETQAPLQQGVKKVKSATEETIGNDLLWFGWTYFESGEDAWTLTASDDGHAYGRYQFDDRHCLGDFLRFCVEEDRANYESFTTFYYVDSNGKTHIKNTECLPEEWSWICYLKGEDFYALQTQFALEAYYEPAKTCLQSECKVDLDEYSPVLRGTIMSLAIRNGHYASGLTSAINTYSEGIDERVWLQEIYAAEAAHHPDQAPRWESEQKQAALEALTAFEKVVTTKKGLKKLKAKYSFEPIL